MAPRLAPSIATLPATGPTLNDRLAAAAARIRRFWPATPSVGLILGSGLHRLADAIETELKLKFDDVPGLLAPTAQGHQGNLLCGTLAGLPVIACQGRLHHYEGHSRKQLQFPVRLFADLGASTLVLSNAAGGVNPEFGVGDVMVVDQHVDLIERPLVAGLMDWSEQPKPVTSCYDTVLADVAFRRGTQHGWPVRRGVYAALDGPNYESRAEYRMLRSLGIDTVGMSTAPEAEIGFQLGMRVLALSTVTNACDPDALGETSGDAVIAAAELAESHVRGIVWDVLSELPVS